MDLCSSGILNCLLYDGSLSLRSILCSMTLVLPRSDLSLENTSWFSSITSRYFAPISGPRAFICSPITSLSISSFSLSHFVLGGGSSFGLSSSFKSNFLQLASGTASRAPTTVPLGMTSSTSMMLSIYTSKCCPTPSTIVSAPATGTAWLPIDAITSSSLSRSRSMQLTLTSCLDPAGILVSLRVLI